jgi:hypothetical protein
MNKKDFLTPPRVMTQKSFRAYQNRLARFFNETIKDIEKKVASSEKELASISRIASTPQRRRKLPLAVVNERLQNLSHGMSVEDNFPRNPNWIIELEDIIKMCGIPLRDFARISSEPGLWPVFRVVKGRLRVANPKSGVATAEKIFELFQMAYQRDTRTHKI